MKQQELNRLLEEVLDECKRINIPVSSKISPDIFINRRAKSRFGCCRRVSQGFIIEIGEMMLDAKPEHIKNILAHEVLHSCNGCQNHGKKWKAYAAAMNQAYGYKITTTGTYEKMGLEKPQEVRHKKYNYMIQCQSCGKIIYRQRKSKIITHTNHYRCTCGGFLKCYKNS